MLPNTILFNPFDPVLADDLDELMENQTAIADGSGVEPDSINRRIVNHTKTGAGGVAWEELGRFEATSPVDTYTIDNLPERKHLKVIFCHLPSGGIMNGSFRVNNDSSVNYAVRVSDNGAAEATIVSATAVGGIDTGAVNTDKLLGMFEISNDALKEKLWAGWCMSTVAGVGNAPKRREYFAKWCNTADKITRLDFIKQTGIAGAVGIGSYCIVLGHN